MIDIEITEPTTIRGYTIGGKGGTAAHSTQLHRLTRRRADRDIALCGMSFSGKVSVQPAGRDGLPSAKQVEKYGLCAKCWAPNSREAVLDRLGEKLDPRNFTAMSGKMAAIVGYLLGEHAVFQTEPAIAELIVTSDGMLLARHEGDVGANDFIGSAADLEDNLERLVVAAGLDDSEKAAFADMRRKITDHRRTS